MIPAFKSLSIACCVAILSSFSNSVRQTDSMSAYYLVQVFRDGPNVHEDWARVISSKDSIGAKISMITFLERKYPKEGELHGWLIRRLNFGDIELNVVSVRLAP